jgi:hypothetical protein
MPAFATCRGEQLTITTGEPTSYRSSPRATRYFCGRCSSSLFWIEDESDELAIFLGGGAMEVQDVEWRVEATRGAIGTDEPWSPAALGLSADTRELGVAVRRIWAE